MSEPLRYLDEMERVQRDLGRTLSEVEAGLAEARSGRLAPVRLGTTGYHGVRPDRRGEPHGGDVSLPSPPEKPADLKAALDELSGTTAPLGRGDPVDRRNGEPALSAPMVASGSLVHDRVVVGNRRAIELIAAARVTVPVDGDPGLRELFPGFDPGTAEAFDVEITIHLIGPASGEDEGLEIGAVVPAMIAAGWPFSCWPWTESIRRRLVRDLRLPQAVASHQPNPREPGSGGRLFGGDAFVVLALDPGSGRKRSATDGPLYAGADGSAARDPVGDERERDRNASGKSSPGGQDEGDARLPVVGLSAGLSRAWRVFREASTHDVGFEEFLEALADHERGVRSAVSAGDAIEAFIESCRATGAPPSSGSRAPDERPTVRAAPAIPSLEEEAGFRVRFSERRLRWKFKHAPDFGVHERYGRAAILAFRAAIEEHVASASTRHEARLHGVSTVAHVGQGRVVWTSPDGAFVTGYGASPDQLRWLWAQPEWRRP